MATTDINVNNGFLLITINISREPYIVFQLLHKNIRRVSSVRPTDIICRVLMFMDKRTLHLNIYLDVEHAIHDDQQLNDGAFTVN